MNRVAGKTMNGIAWFNVPHDDIFTATAELLLAIRRNGKTHTSVAAQQFDNLNVLLGCGIPVMDEEVEVATGVDACSIG
jgi:hypothetical protein